LRALGKLAVLNMADSSDYELGKVSRLKSALDFRSTSGGFKSLSILKAGLFFLEVTLAYPDGPCK
jgi:hypothetical protein